jgi:hypothetical protein
MDIQAIIVNLKAVHRWWREQEDGRRALVNKRPQNNEIHLPLAKTSEYSSDKLF